jgi:hypothetical protein
MEEKGKGRLNGKENAASLASFSQPGLWVPAAATGLCVLPLNTQLLQNTSTREVSSVQPSPMWGGCDHYGVRKQGPSTIKSEQMTQTLSKP